MRDIFFSPLTRRITSLIVLALIITAVVILGRSDDILEQALLEQTKRQAKVFMYGIESKLHDLPHPRDPQALQSVVDDVMHSDLSLLDFSIYQMYFFDRQGKILAHSAAGPHADKQLTSRYEPVFNQYQSIVGDSVEKVIDKVTGNEVTKTDIIVPHHLDGEVFAALELEIDLNKTLQAVNAVNARYRTEIYTIVVIASLATVIFIWFGMYRWTILPIRRLAGVTERISEGELNARFPTVKTKDELSQLGQSVNHMAESIENLFNEQEQAHIQMLQSLSKALEAKDAYTAGHSGRVAHFSVKLGLRIGLSSQEITLLKQGALMHDLGKIGIADVVLNKPGKLDAPEYEIMKKHPVMTASIMRPLKRFKEFTEIAAWHHERWDGTGYPDGLKGEKIPLLARIVCIADGWDAMTGDRVYRKGMSAETAISIMKKEIHNGQWDPELLGHFINMIEEELEAKVQGTHPADLIRSIQ
jgi:HAMP domain-containing protein